MDSNNTSGIEGLSKIYKEKLTKKQFNKISNFITEHVGIKLPEEKLIMLQSRLYKRLKELKIDNFSDYIEYAFNPGNNQQEIVNMIDVISTNKTSFFREPHHFDFIISQILPKYSNNSSKLNNLQIWSAGCSSGEEAYSIAMVVHSFLEYNRNFSYNITGTDISTQILQKAVNAIYPAEKIEEIPHNYRSRYLLKSKDKIKPTIRISPELRNKVQFHRLNLMDKVFRTNKNFDIIFCRNVLIYFTRDIQELVINKLCNCLKPGGYLFIGHSESLFNMNLPLAQIKPTIFQKTGHINDH